MSLFKVRDFWTFDLDALQLQSNDANAHSSSTPPDGHFTEANYTASVGRFNSIGKQDVFVCGDLRGFIYVIQVPNSDQRKYTKATNRQEADLESSGSSSPSARVKSNHDAVSASSAPSTDMEERQLLAATNLHIPIVDIQCGYFTSAIKQTIAVLSFNKLTILQVKRNQNVDSQAASEDLLYPSKQRPTNKIDESLLSHGFEEYVSLDLLDNEFAHNILVLNNHAESNLVSHDSHYGTEAREQGKMDFASVVDKVKNRSGDADNKFVRNKQAAEQLHLPQRDKIIVQYMNQFVFTLIDSKKITGHYSMFSLLLSDNQARGTNLDASRESNANEIKMQQMSCYAGGTPMAHLYCTNNKFTSSLIVSFTDHQIYCVPLDKLINLAKQDIMKRVAQNLIHNKGGRGIQSQEDKLIDIEKPSSLAHMNKDHLLRANDRTIAIDIEALSEWTCELMAMPLQMQSVQRQAKSAISVDHKNGLTVSQLLIMSRYSLDLFTSSGQHLWSQRFETPLVCVSAYTIDLSDVTADGDDADNQQHSKQTLATMMSEDGKRNQINFRDQLVSLLCTDSLSAGKSNLNILKDDQIIWSALLNAKPYRIWRLNLVQIPGALASLDTAHGQLIASYLGTNNIDSTGVDDGTIHSDANESNEDSKSEISKLELLNEPLFRQGKLGPELDAEMVGQDNSQDKRLVFEVSLEASDKWPQVSVDVRARIQLESSVTGVIHNIVAHLEYDDLLKFQMSLTDEHQSLNMPTISYPSQGVARIQLGNCWPDRREPLSFRGTFNLFSKSKGSFGTSAMNGLELNKLQQTDIDIDSRLVPKSLKVKVFLNYNETHSGLMIQQEAFLLPINMISQLTHIDYSSGSGQDLSDILGNLPGYRRAKDKKDTSAANGQPYYSCDLFLNIDYDLVGLLEEMVENDLLCRGMNSGLRERQQRTAQVKKVETLENINLLAQSLDCRLRYKSPSSVSRQSSEELSLPVLATFCLSFDNIYATLPLDDGTTSNKRSDRGEQEEDSIVWMHICDMATNESTLTEELVAQHMKDWMNYSSKLYEEDVSTSGESAGDSRKNLMIAIECDKPLPVTLVLNHILDRVECSTKIDSRLDCKLIMTNQFSAYKDFLDFIDPGPRIQLAISSNLHTALVKISNKYEMVHKNKFKQLRDDLAQESCKFQIVTTTTLSLSKRLPGLPDDLAKQLAMLNALIRQYQQKLISLLEESESLRKLDYEFSKIPSVSIIKLELASGHERTLHDCPCFKRIIV